MRRGLLLLALIPALADSPSDHIGTIDFFGYGHLDVAVLRAALPFAEGDKLPSNALRDEALRRSPASPDASRYSPAPVVRPMAAAAYLLACRRPAPRLSF